MFKYVIWGIGKRYYNCKQYIDGTIVGLIDKYRAGEFTTDGSEIKSPGDLPCITFDKIIITVGGRKKIDIYNEVCAIVPDRINDIIDIEDYVSVERFINLYGNSIKHIHVKDISKINKSGKIFVIAEPERVSGGPELLHQLVGCLNAMGKEAYIAYVNCKMNNAQESIPPIYREYVGSNVVSYEEIDDESEVLVVIPETMGEYIHDFSNARIMFWWLSVNYFLTNVNDEIINDVKTKVHTHLYQSEYARQFVKKIGIPNERMMALSDYINEDYINVINVTKKNQIAYNPVKGFTITMNLIKELSNIKFVPIINMTKSEIQELLGETKLYIDFGTHPGKDRLPREAAISGCCVITGRRGAASNSKDIPILDKYKVDSINAIDSFKKLIKYCFKNYDEAQKDFEEYREKIKNEKKIFVSQVEEVFGGAI